MAVNIYTTGAPGHGKTTLTAAIMYCLGTEYASLNGSAAGGADSSGVARESYATAAHQYAHADCPDAGCAAMLASSPKMNVALLVVAAEDGPRKETVDAIARAKAAGVERVAVFLGKADLVPDEELLELVEMEIRELLGSHGYRGDSIPVVSGSATAVLASQGTRADKTAASVFALMDAIDSNVPTAVQ
jgi:elongation factor Tu